MTGRYAKFYDLTFLYPKYKTYRSIDHNNKDQYHAKIKNLLRTSDGKYKDGDILFIGSTYETRQEYGFATVTQNGTNFKQGDEPIMNTPGVYYKEAIKEINKFIYGLYGILFFDEDWIKNVKNSGHYNKTITNTNNTKEFLRLRTRLKILTNRKQRGENINMVAYKKLMHTAFRLGQKISGKSNIGNAVKNAKAISAATRIQRAFRLKIRTNKEFLEEYRKWKRSLNAEEGEIPNNVNTRRLINYANKKYGTENLNLARNMILNKMHSPAKKIQQAFRKSRLTNAQLVRLWNIQGQGRYVTTPQHLKMISHAKRISGKYNVEKAIGTIRSKRNTNVKAVPAVTKIQSVFRGYKSRNIDPRRQFLLSLSKDGRFDYYVEVLAKLEHKVQKVLNMVSQNVDPVSAITGVIGVCHYKARPHKTVQKVANVRKSLPLLKKKTPREYLQSFRKQFSYVAKEYAKMDDKNKKAYRDRLESELSGRPCLENLLDSLSKALVKQEFVWLGKSRNYQNNPLQVNNIRYLGYGPNLGTKKGLVNTAVQTWRNSGNRPANWNNKNLNSRKKMFWNMIKKLPLSMVYQGNLVNGTPNLYNENGKKFKSSNLANTLEYM